MLNKELIKKYQKEFNHWLNDKRIYALMDNPEEEWLKISLYDTAIFNKDYPTEIKAIVIGDHYIQYRKALIEGKTIQFYGCIEQHKTESSLDKYDWIDWKGAEASSSFTETLKYRIKPDENKFKVDDWVIELCPDVDDYCKPKPSGEPFQIKEVIKGNTGWLYKKEKDNYNRELFEAYLIKWKPQANEWCWFWDASHEIKYSNLSQFVDMYGTKFRTKGATYENCAPFTEKLPQHLKDLK